MSNSAASLALGLTSGIITSGYIGNAAVVSGSLASGVGGGGGGGPAGTLSSGQALTTNPGATFGPNNTGTSGYSTLSGALTGIHFTPTGGPHSGQLASGIIPYNIVLGDSLAGQGLNNYTQANVFLGIGAGASLSAGPADVPLYARDNVGIGLMAMALTNLGGGNVAIGTQALFNNNGGSQNTAIGFECLIDNTGDGNTGIGWGAGGNCLGAYNTFIGTGAGRNSTFGSTNTFIGNNADCADNGSGQSNAVGIGTSSFCPDGSVVIGTGSGTNGLVGSGFNLTVIGTGSAIALTTGTDNTFIGNAVAILCDSGGFNVVIGSAAAGALTGGSNNILLGAGSNVNSASTSSAIIAGAGVIGDSTSIVFSTQAVTSTTVNDFLIESGDVGLRRADPAVLTITDGGVGTHAGALQLSGIPTASEPPVSPSHSARLYYNSTTDKLMYSTNGSAYAVWPGF